MLTTCRLLRQLEEELQREKVQRQKEKDDFMKEIARLKEDNERQRQLLTANISKTPQSQAEAYLTYEVNRLVAENLVNFQYSRIFLLSNHHNDEIFSL